ncbi:MAG TPA: oligonucleotide/oligosaccharide-binding fold domain-containing protein, partial [Spirochaetota bacterium]|nr:oligonucleotide/oligosaccharide-binding fold domain-containing protein [Spirochaetota bacterium]
KRMVDFPLLPRLSRILLEASFNFLDVTNAILIIISFLSAKSPFLYPPGEEIESRKAQKKLASKGGDFFSWINIFIKYQKDKKRDEFCRKYYLDMRSMNEVLNVHAQLTSMMYEKGYSIGYNLDNEKIAVCICTGLKQYICVKSTKKLNTYKSITENGIRIHPGSYLYSQNPDWIVAGEIVNTGRTYARTAVALSEKMIKSKFLEVYNDIMGKSAENKKIIKEKATFAKTREVVEETQINLCGKYFDIIAEKKEKIVIVPYHIIVQLKNQKEKVLKHNFTNINARLIYKDTVVLKDKFKSLVQYFDKIDLDNGINLKFPRTPLFLYPNDWNNIYNYLNLILRPTKVSHKSSKIGFLALRFLGENNFEYYLEKDFFCAIEESLNAIEKIFDNEVTAWNEKEKRVIEEIHHKLNNLSEEMDV